jgi:hypothetical protein
MSNQSLREIIEFYSHTEEEARLAEGPAQLEFERTKECDQHATASAHGWSLSQ